MKDFDAAIAKLIDAAAEDFRAWRNRGTDDDGLTEKAVSNFRNEFEVVKGRKYAKVTNRGSAWAFIVVVENDKKFRYGDILKPASWSTPARNSARGNIFEDYKIRWTGPLYLK